MPEQTYLCSFCTKLIASFRKQYIFIHGVKWLHCLQSWTPKTWDAPARSCRDTNEIWKTCRMPSSCIVAWRNHVPTTLTPILPILPLLGEKCKNLVWQFSYVTSDQSSREVCPHSIQWKPHGHVALDRPWFQWLIILCSSKYIASPRKYRSYSNCEYRHSSTNSLLHQHQLLSLSFHTDIADFASYVRNKFLHCSFNPCVAQCLPETSNAGLKSLKLSRMLGPHLIDLLLWNLNMQKSEGTHTSLPLGCHTKSIDKWHCHLWI